MPYFSVSSKNIINELQLFYSHQGGNTAVHAATGKGHVDAVKLLLDREVKMNAKDSVRKRSYMLMFYFYMKFLSVL